MYMIYHWTNGASYLQCEYSYEPEGIRWYNQLWTLFTNIEVFSCVSSHMSLQRTRLNLNDLAQ
jgi:hypothetical protein